MGDEVVQRERVVLHHGLDGAGAPGVEPAERQAGQLRQQTAAQAPGEPAVHRMQPQQQRRLQHRAGGEQDHGEDPHSPQRRRVGTGQQPPAELGQQHVGRELQDRQQRLGDAGGDEYVAQRREEASRASRAPPSPRRLGGRGRGGRGGRGGGVGGGGVGGCRAGIRVAPGAHRLALRPVGLRVDLRLGEAEFLEPLADLLERARLGGRPRVPVAPVARLERVGQRGRAGPPDPPRAHPRVGAERDLTVARVVLLEVQLDGDLPGHRREDGVDRGDRGRVADEQVAGRRLVRDLERPRAHEHEVDGHPRLGAGRPPRGGPGGFVQHEVQGEPAVVGVGLGEGVAALELASGAVREPPAHPGRRSEVHVVEKRGRVEPDACACRADLLHLAHRRLMVARAHRAHDRAAHSS